MLRPRMLLSLTILFVKLHIHSGLNSSSQCLSPHRVQEESCPISCLELIQKLPEKTSNFFHTQHYSYQYKEHSRLKVVGNYILLVIYESNIIRYF